MDYYNLVEVVQDFYTGYWMAIRKYQQYRVFFLCQFFNEKIWFDIRKNGWNGLVTEFMNVYDVMFDASKKKALYTQVTTMIENFGEAEGLTTLGEGRDEVLTVDKTLFREELTRLMSKFESLNAYEFFKLVHAAYDFALGDTHKKKLIFYHIHNPDTFTQLNFSSLAPNTRWLLMVREPVQNCESTISFDYYKDVYKPCFYKIAWIFNEIDNPIYNEQDSIGVRLEDLKRYPRKTIPALCKWLGIQETESLYEMTAQGKKWWGDPSSPDYTKDGMDPFGQTSINRKVGSIFSESDQFILRTLFYPFSASFGYVEENQKGFEKDLKVIRPMLEQMFDFERNLMESKQLEADQFMKSGPYLYLRSVLIERWDILNEYKTYPNMLKMLKIE